jgi:hypothetical protein
MSLISKILFGPEPRPERGIRDGVVVLRGADSLIANRHKLKAVQVIRK